MIELKNLDKVSYKNWLNLDGTLNVDKMQIDIKKTLIEEHKRSMEWQRLALKWNYWSFTRGLI